MREGIAIADSGPLIAFSRINRLELLHELFLKIIIPVAVWNEVTIRGKGLPGALEVSQVAWIKVQAPPIRNWLNPSVFW